MLDSSVHSREGGNPERAVPVSRFRGDERPTSAPFPWARALAIGLGVLRLSPEAFWRMTPREFAAALRGLYGEPATPIDRAALDALLARFPDRSRP